MPGEEGSLEGRIDEAWDALEDGETERALAIARNLLAEEGRDPEVFYLAGSALMEAERLDEAEPHLRRALEADPAHPEARAALAQLLYDRCRFEEARAEVEILLDADAEDARSHHLASLLSERRGDFARAGEEERMAHRLEPELYPLPPRFTRAEFEACVEAAIEELKGEFRERMGNLAIVVEEVPPLRILEMLDDPSPGLLGLFVGTPLPEKHHGQLPSPPDAIYLFKRNLERISESRDELVEEIRITLLHEVGHFMGLDERQIAERGFD